MVADILTKETSKAGKDAMLIYKILACIVLVGFAVAAYLYVIFQMPTHLSDKNTTGDQRGTINSFLAKTINDG